MKTYSTWSRKKQQILLRLRQCEYTHLVYKSRSIRLYLTHLHLQSSIIIYHGFGIWLEISKHVMTDRFSCGAPATFRRQKMLYNDYIGVQPQTSPTTSLHLMRMNISPGSWLCIMHNPISSVLSSAHVIVSFSYFSWSNLPYSNSPGMTLSTQGSKW